MSTAAYEDITIEEIVEPDENGLGIFRVRFKVADGLEDDGTDFNNRPEAEAFAEELKSIRN